MSKSLALMNSIGGHHFDSRRLDHGSEDKIVKAVQLGGRLGLTEKTRNVRGLDRRGRTNCRASVAKSHPYISTSGYISARSMQSRVHKAVDNMVRKSTGAMTTTDLANGAKLLEAQTAYIFALIKHEPTILAEARMVGLDSKDQRIDRMHFASRIFHKATEGTELASGKRSKVTPSKIQMSAKDFAAEIRISYETLEQNVMRLARRNMEIRGSAFENMVLALAAERAALDFEEFALLSDTASTDDDLDQFNGWIKTAQSNNTYSHSGVKVNKSFFKNTYKQLPKEYRRNKKVNLRFYVPTDVEVEWIDEITDRVGNVGDMLMSSASGENSYKTGAYSIPIVCNSTLLTNYGTGTDEAKVLCTDPRNLVFALFRNLYLDADKDIGTREARFVLSASMDAKMEQPEGCSIGEDVEVS